MPQSNILHPYIVTGLSPWRATFRWSGAPLACGGETPCAVCSDLL